MRIGGDVEIFRLAIHQEIAHAAAAEIGAVSAAMKAVEDFQDILRNAPPRDWMLAAVNHDAFRRRNHGAFRRRDDGAVWRRDDGAVDTG